jgi:hypothetical protein
LVDQRTGARDTRRGGSRGGRVGLLAAPPAALALAIPWPTLSWVPAFGADPKPKPAATHGLRSGQGVFHTKFGEGVILTLEGKGDVAGAIAEYEQAAKLLNDDPAPLGLLGAAKAKAGQPDAARAILRQLEETAKRRYVPDFLLSTLHLALGEKEEALAWLESAFAKRQPDVAMIRVDPVLKPLYGDPRFEALLNDPKLLIFDEPTSGLDPSQVIAIRDLIRELAGRRTVLMASHVLPEIEQIASRVMILLNGRLLTTDALALAVDAQRLRLQVAGPEPMVREAIAAVPGVRSIVVEPESGGPDLRYLVEADQRPEVAQQLAAALVGRGLALSELTTVRPDLERIFLQLTRRPSEAAA